MHDYTARILHEDRMKQLRHEADGSRLAAEARDARQTQAASTSGSGWLVMVAARSSAWLRRYAQAYRLRGRLRPAADPQLGEDA